MTTTPRSRPRTALALGLLPLLVMGLSACSGTDGADGDRDTSASSVERQARDFDLALASCMRDAGFEMSDPGNGGSEIDLGAVDDSDAYLEAFTDCQASVTDELGERPFTEAEERQMDEATKEYEKVQECLEEKGVVFPDAENGVVKAPDVPADVAAACGAEDMFPSGSGR